MYSTGGGGKMKRVIEIKPNNDNIFNLIKKPKVAAYARVSTDKNEQIESIQAQVKHYTDYINRNSDWDFGGIYIDEGISGTKKENRKELQRLIKDVKAQKIDYIITKSISRFARNTSDCLELVRLFSDLGVGVIFEKEGIDTKKSDSELILSVLSAIAAEESVSISQNNKWSIRKRFENGTFKLSSHPYGYDYDGNTLIINLEQASVVKKIFNYCLSGKGARSIAMALNREGVISPKGGKWNDSTVRVILQNEKYTGDAILQKTFMDHNYKQQKNEGQLDQYYIENSHPGIISKTDYEKVRVITQQRGKEKGCTFEKEKYSEKYVFSGIIKCEKCGSSYRRRIYYPNKNKEYVAYLCNNHLKSNGKDCDALFIKEAEVHKAFIIMMNKLYTNRDKIIKPLIISLRRINSENANSEILEMENRIRENKEKVKVLVDLMSKGYLDFPVFNERNNLLKSEYAKLKEALEQIKLNSTGDESMEDYLESLYGFLVKEANYMEDFNEEIFMKFVETITVNSPTQLVFNLKCGLSLMEKIGR